MRAAIAVWAKELAGLSADELLYGYHRCTEKFPRFPPLAHEFRGICAVDPSDIGLPPLHEAWGQVSSEGRPFTHGVVLAAAQDPDCDTWNWRNLPLGRGAEMFEPIYARYITRFMQGEVFELPTMLEDKQDKPVTKEERIAMVNKYMGDIKDSLK